MLRLPNNNKPEQTCPGLERQVAKLRWYAQVAHPLHGYMLNLDEPHLGGEVQSHVLVAFF